jgi:hypothetical protein
MNPKSFDASSLFGKKKSASAQTTTNSEPVSVSENTELDSAVVEANEASVLDTVETDNIETASEPVSEDVVTTNTDASDDMAPAQEITPETAVENTTAPVPSPAFVAESKESFIDEQEQHKERPAVLDTGVVAEPSVASASITNSRTDVRDVSCSDLYGASGTKLLKSLESVNILYRVFGDKRCTSMRAVVVSPATFQVILEQLALKNVNIDIAEKTIPWFTDVAFSSLSNGKLFRDGTLVHAIARRDLRPAGVASVLIQKSAPAVAYLLPANLYALACE